MGTCVDCVYCKEMCIDYVSGIFEDMCIHPSRGKKDNINGKTYYKYCGNYNKNGECGLYILKPSIWKRLKDKLWEVY